jgi:hypothetical protein
MEKTEIKAIWVCLEKKEKREVLVKEVKWDPLVRYYRLNRINKKN